MSALILHRPASVVCVKPAPPKPTGLPWAWTATDLLALAVARFQRHPEHTGADESFQDDLVALNPANTGRHYAHNIRPVEPGYRLSPAARQLVAPTPEAVHAGVTDSTGLLDLTAVRALTGGAQ